MGLLTGLVFSLIKLSILQVNKMDFCGKQTNKQG